jgi:hypothetical protein
MFEYHINAFFFSYQMMGFDFRDEESSGSATRDLMTTI